MRLLLYDMGAYTQNDIMWALRKMNIPFKNILYKLSDVENDAFFERKVTAYLNSDHYDAVVSVNYWPVLAKICWKEGVKYIAWSYDSPVDVPDIKASLGYETNYIFLFDRAESERYRQQGYTNVYHLPLAVNTERLDQALVSAGQRQQYGAEISMLGEMYRSPLQDLLQMLPDYEKGYLSSVVQAQLRIYGANLVRELVDDAFMAKMNEVFVQNIGKGLQKTAVQIWMAKQVTHIERYLLMEILSEDYQVKLFSSREEPELTKVHWEGSAGYFDEMPYVFKSSKININATLRCIETGIPLRALDIIGCGGFLLSNYQAELAEYFVDGEEIVLYQSIEDAVMKCDYYLKHQEERERIARNGYEKVKQEFTYEKRLGTIFKTVFGLSL